MLMYHLGRWKADQSNAFRSPASVLYGRCGEYQMCQMSLLSRLCTEGRVHLSLAICRRIPCGNSVCREVHEALRCVHTWQGRCSKPGITRKGKTVSPCNMELPFCCNKQVLQKIQSNRSTYSIFSRKRPLLVSPCSHYTSLLAFGFVT